MNEPAPIEWAAVYGWRDRAPWTRVQFGVREYDEYLTDAWVDGVPVVYGEGSHVVVSREPYGWCMWHVPTGVA